jgi:hypothetical protein
MCDTYLSSNYFSLSLNNSISWCSVLQNHLPHPSFFNLCALWHSPLSFFSLKISATHHWLVGVPHKREKLLATSCCLAVEQIHVSFCHHTLHCPFPQATQMQLTVITCICVLYFLTLYQSSFIDWSVCMHYDSYSRKVRRKHIHYGSVH